MISKGELYIHIFLFVIMGFLFGYTYTFPELEIGGKLGPGWWPRATLGLAMILTIISAYQSIKTHTEKERVTSQELKSFGLSTLIFAIYIILIQSLGFVLTTPFLLGAYIYQMNVRKKSLLILVPLIITAVFIIVFGRIMYVALPRGSGILRTYSFYLY